MKRILAIILSVIMMVSLILPITSGAADIKEGKCGEDAYWKLDMSTGELTVYGTGATDHYYCELCDDTEYDPIATFEYNKSLPNAPFYEYKDSILKIIVENGITELGRGLFLELDKCKSAELPESLLVIHPMCFRRCTEIEYVNAPDSLVRIGYNAFAVCSNLKEFIWPEGVTTIERDVFVGCSSITEFEIPRTVTSVDELGFNGYIKTLFVPNTLDGKFYDFGDVFVEEIIFEEGFTEITTDIIATPVSKRIVIPKTVKKIRGRLYLNDISDISLFEMSYNAHTYVKAIKLCYTGTDEEWNALLSKNESYVEFYGDRLEATNYTYTYNGSNVDPKLNESDVPSDTVVNTVESTTSEEYPSESDINTSETKKTDETTNYVTNEGFWSKDARVVIIISATVILALAIVIIIVYKRRKK